MRNPFARGQGPSLGERRMVLGCLITAILGAFLALIVILRLDPEAVFQRALSSYERWILLSGGIGGAFGVLLARHRLGRSGLADALLGVGVMTFSGAIIGGTLALPLYGTMFGPFTVGVIFAASPMIALLWLANGVAVHLLLRSWHAERDSIFGARPPQPVLAAVGGLLGRRRGTRINP